MRLINRTIVINKPKNEPKAPTQLRDLFEKLSVTTLIVVYFFVCGGLYLIAYWGKFSLDITPFIGITDIPKSFILPFKSSGLVVSFLFITFSVSGALYASTWRGYSFGFLLTCGVGGVVLGAFITNSYSFNFSRENLYVIFGASILLLVSLLAGKFFPKTGNPLLTRVLIVILIALPIYCYITGDFRASDVYSNYNIFRIEKLKVTDSTLNVVNGSKLIGYMGDKVVLATTNNEQFFIINQSELPALKLTFYQFYNSDVEPNKAKFENQSKTGVNDSVPRVDSLKK